MANSGIYCPMCNNLYYEPTEEHFRKNHGVINTIAGAHVYTAIVEVIAAMSKEGIAKGRKNAQQGWSFRGIDDVYNALAPMLAAAGLCVLPRVMSRSVTEQPSKSGGTLFYVVLEVEYDFVSAKDGSKHTCRSVGEAMDSGDKATNKAMSAAFKYAAMQAFCIPTEGDHDSENQTHEVAARVHPYPDGMDQVDPEIAKEYADGFIRAIEAQDVGKVFDLHLELRREEALYSSVGRLLNTKQKAALRAVVSERSKVA